MDDFDKLVKYFQGSRAMLEAAAKRGVHRAGLLVEGDAKRLCPVKTGRLRTSISTEVQQNGQGAVATVGTNVEYAADVEYGTGGRGDSAVDHRVDWAGNPPRPYLRPALQFNEESGNIQAVINYEVGRVLK